MLTPLEPEPGDAVPVIRIFPLVVPTTLPVSTVTPAPFAALVVPFRTIFDVPSKLPTLAPPEITMPLGWSVSLEAPVMPISALPPVLPTRAPAPSILTPLTVALIFTIALLLPLAPIPATLLTAVPKSSSDPVVICTFTLPV